MAIIVQLVTRSKKVLSSQKIESDHVTIGRAYDNDIILQDDHVCPNHAQIKMLEDGSVLLENLSEVNGIQDLKNGKLEPITTVKSGDVFAFGKVFIRILQPDHPIAPTKKLNVFEDISRIANNWFVAISFALVFFLSFTFQSYVGTFDEIIWSKIIAKSLMVVLGLLTLPALITLFTWLFKREIKFFAATSFCFCLIILLQWISAFNNVLYFNVGYPTIILLLADLAEVVIFTVFLWGALYLMSNMSQKKISVISSSLVIVLYTLTHFSNQSDKVKLAPNYSAQIFPSSFMFVQPVSAKEYTHNLAQKFDAASKESERRNKEADEHKN